MAPSRRCVHLPKHRTRRRASGALQTQRAGRRLLRCEAVFWANGGVVRVLLPPWKPIVCDRLPHNDKLGVEGVTRLRPSRPRKRHAELSSGGADAADGRKCDRREGGRLSPAGLWPGIRSGPRQCRYRFSRSDTVVSRRRQQGIKCPSPCKELRHPTALAVHPNPNPLTL